MSTVIVIRIIDGHSGALGAHVALGAQLARDNYQVDQPVRRPVHTGYLTFSARCPSCQWPISSERSLYACMRACICIIYMRAHTSA